MKKRIGLMLLAAMISCVWLAAGAGAEGCLILENDMQKMVFEREGAPGTASTGPASAPLIAVEDPEALTGTWEAGWVSLDLERLGEWYAVYMKTGRIEGDPKTLYKMDITLTLNGNHTGVLHSMGTEDQRRWSVADDGSVLFGEDTLTLREDGFLIMKTTQNSIMIFHQDPKAKWKAGTPIE